MVKFCSQRFSIRFLFLLVLIQFLLVFFTYEFGQNTAHLQANKLLTWTLDEIQDIQLEKKLGQKDVLISKKGMAWRLTNYFYLPASEQKIDRLVGILFNAKKTKFVGQGEEALVRFRLQKKDDPWVLELSKKDQPIKQFWIKQQGQKFYIRNSQETKVYEARGFEPFKHAFNGRFWLEKNVSISESQIQGIVLNNQLSILKQDNQWQLEHSSKKLDQQAYLVFLDHFANRLFVSSAFKKKDLPVNKSVYQIQVKKIDGSTLNILFYKLKDQYYLSHSAYPNVVFQIPFLTFERFVFDQFDLLQD